MMLPLTKVQVWREFTKTISEKGFFLVSESKSFKDQFYTLYLDEFIRKEIPIGVFIEDFMIYWDTESHRCIDDMPPMQPNS